MDLKPTDFNKLKAFVTLFLKLKSIRRIPGVFTVKGLPVNKTDCLSLLRSFPELQGEVFKNDDNLSKYLSVTSNLERIISKLRAPSQRAELTSLLDLEQKAVGETMQTAEPTNNQGAPTDQIPPTNTSGPPTRGGMPAGLPSLGPSTPYRPPARIVYNVPHAPETETKLALANKSGAVVGEATITPTSTTIRGTAPETSKLYTANSSGVITGERGLKSETPQPKLVLANSSGIVKEAGEPSKFVTTNSSGKIVKGPGAETPPSKIFITRSDGTVLREHAIKPMSRFSAFRSKVGGKITNAARIGLEKANPFLKRAGNGLVNNLTSIVSPGGIGGGGTGSRSIFGKVSRFGRGGGSGGIGSLATKAKKRGGLIFALGALGFMMLVGAIAVSGTPSTGEAVPITPPGNGTPPTPTIPCTDGDYKTCLYDNYKLEFRPGTNISFSADFLQMTYQAMQSAELVAPKFKERIHDACPVITAVPTNTTSHVATCTLNLKPTIGKVAFIHELGHVIRNSNPSFYDGIIKQARVLDASYWEGGFLTYYSKFASTPDDFKTNCYPESTGGTYLLDEEFAESITYFINKDDNEINMGPGCSVKWADNPYQGGNRYKGHYNLINSILK